MLCLIFFGISATIILDLVLGQKTGDFVIRVQDGTADKSIMITEVKPEGEIDENTLTPVLTPPGASGFSDYSPYFFLTNGFSTLEEYTSEGGVYKHSRGDSQSVSLYCYTFFVVNTGASAVNVDVDMSYQLPNGGQLDDIIRVMSYTTDSFDNQKAIIYQKPDTIPHDYENYPDLIGLSKDFFVSDSVIFNNEKLFVDLDDYVKYSIVFWLEGDDPDSSADAAKYYSQTIKFELNLKVNMAA